MRGIEARIRHLVGEYNADLTLRMWIALGVGIVSTVVLVAFCFGFGWLVLGRLDVFGSAVTAGWAFAGLVVVAAFVSVLLKQDSMAGLPPLSDAQLNLIMVSLASPHFLYTSPRHALAGFADLLVHGPRCIVESVGLSRARLSSSGEMVRGCCENLVRMDRGLRVDDIVPKRAGVQLYRLGLIKVDRREGAPAEEGRFVRTGKGEDVLRGVTA